MPSHIPTRRQHGLPADLRAAIVAARRERGWTQAEVGKRVGLPQMHISGIERGKIVPRFDTLLDLVRVLDRDFLLVRRGLVPAVQAMIRGGSGDEERPLYAVEPGEEDV